MYNLKITILIQKLKICIYFMDQFSYLEIVCSLQLAQLFLLVVLDV